MHTLTKAIASFFQQYVRNQAEALIYYCLLSMHQMYNYQKIQIMCISGKGCYFL